MEVTPSQFWENLLKLAFLILYVELDQPVITPWWPAAVLTNKPRPLERASATLAEHSHSSTPTVGPWARFKNGCF